MLVEGAWTYRLPAGVSQELLKRAEGLPEEIRTISWKAQGRLWQNFLRHFLLFPQMLVVSET
jgi:hypothetical protein